MLCLWRCKRIFTLHLSLIPHDSTAWSPPSDAFPEGARLHVCWGCWIGRWIRVLRGPGRKKKRFLRSPSGHLDSINPDWGPRVCIFKHRLRQILMRGLLGHTYKKLHVIGIISFRLHRLPTCTFPALSDQELSGKRKTCLHPRGAGVQPKNWATTDAS